MKTILFLIFYIVFNICPASAEHISLDFNNTTDEDVISEASVSRYSILPEGVIEEGEIFIKPHQHKDLELTIVSGSYFEFLEVRPENKVGNQTNRDRLSFEISGEEFIIYWDLVESSTTWKPKVFNASSKYDVEMSASRKNPSHYTFLITEKGRIKTEE